MSDEIQTAPESLLLGDGRQLSLLDVDACGLPASAYSRGEARGEFTGERIFSGNPALYSAIVKLLGRAMPYREIAEICSVSVNTIAAVARRERIPIESIREQLARLGYDVARLSLEAIMDIMSDPELRKKLPVRDLAVLNGIATQNAQLLSGGVTANLGTGEQAKPGHEAYLAAIRNVTGTGFGAGNSGQTRGPGDGVIDLPAAPSAPAAASDSAPNGGPAH